MNPPIRTKDHHDKLWEAVKNSLVSTIGSDHAYIQKKRRIEKYPLSPSGMPGVQTLLPVMLDHVNKRKLKIEQLIKLVCENPCDLFGIKNKGYIKENYDADLTIVDMNKEVVIKDSWIESKMWMDTF